MFILKIHSKIPCGWSNSKQKNVNLQKCWLYQLRFSYVFPSNNLCYKQKNKFILCTLLLKYYSCQRLKITECRILRRQNGNDSFPNFLRVCLWKFYFPFLWGKGGLKVRSKKRKRNLEPVIYFWVQRNL